MTLDADRAPGRCSTAAAVDVTGRLIGGCIETLGPLAGTPYGDVRGVRSRARRRRADRLPRGLRGRRVHDLPDPARAAAAPAGSTHADAVLIGRTAAPDAPDLTQHERGRRRARQLGIPIVLDVECGHVAPYLPLVNGALAHVVVDGDRREITQALA